MPISPHRSRNRNAVLKIVAVYAFFAALWIFLSDKALDAIIPSPDKWATFAIVKGWFFVAITSMLLYFLIERFLREANELTEQRLRTLRLLEVIADKSDDAIYVKDLEGRYLLHNRAAAAYLGKTPDDIIGHDDFALFPKEEADHLITHHKKLIAEQRTETREEAVQTKLGRRIFVATKGPLYGPDGQIFGTFGISRDITEWRRNELELTRLNRALRLLGDSKVSL